MKILYFYQFFVTSKGAWGTRVYEFARRWVKSGDSVTIITSYFDRSDLTPKGLITRYNVDGIDVRMIGIPVSNKHGFTRRIVSYIAYSIVASWYAITLPADVVISSSGPITVGIPGLLARYLRGRPFVFEVRDIWPEGAIELGIIRNRIVIGMARLLEKWCYRASSMIIALSEGAASWIRSNSGVTRIEVVPNASDNDILESAGPGPALPSWTTGKDLAIYVGTVGRANDCGQILDAAEVARPRGYKNIEFVIIGDGVERQALKERAERAGMSNVHFPGLMSRENVLTWMSNARCLVLTLKNVPIFDTSSPNKLFDAFAIGLPVIQTTQGWIKDLLKREHCGITVPPNNPEAIVNAVSKIVNDAALRNDLINNARRVARELFDRDMLASKMLDILRKAGS